jgi:hypothetical protein
MKKKSPPSLSEGPNAHRRQHTAFTRDVLTPPGAPAIGRHRTRTILTPVSVRRSILEDIAAKPQTVQLRSLRRRLTVLDRALGDREAEMLDRLISCSNGLSNVGCVDYLQSEVRSSPFGRLPFGERRRLEIAGMTYVLQRLSPSHRATVLNLAALLDPSHSRAAVTASEDFIASVCRAAGVVVSLYDEWSRRHTRPQGTPSQI